VQITLEIPEPANADQVRTVTVAMDQPPERGDQIILADAYGSIAYRVRRQSWHVEVRRDIYGEVTAHRVQLEPDVDPPALAAAAAPAAAATRAKRAKPAA
jgi:hypothetical protein